MYEDKSLYSILLFLGTQSDKGKAFTRRRRRSLPPSGASLNTHPLRVLRVYAYSFAYDPQSCKQYENVTKM